ncbi:Ubiquitin-like protein 4A [Leptotrombidium deliense]|uniref:Ubiquitin-like protein 4A n=1 Tax=Leptotrombidium deliense TaxID=299467 RepID=A0A443SLP1_9ACAR|nr:Ubiquitin-like protein 4A [Leptotrombidium deliense]
MKISVKLLQGKDLQFEVDANDSVLSLKEKIASKFEIPVKDQRLLFKGKTLNDNENIEAYSIVEGSKLFLSLPTNNVETNEESLFFQSIQDLLKKHFSQEEIPKIVWELKKDAKHLVECLSLDDIERIANRRSSKVDA